MSHKSKMTLGQQANEKFNSMTAYGSSKHADKRAAGATYDRLCDQGRRPLMSKQEYINSALRGKIYSYKTYEGYKKHTSYYLDWCKQNYNCKTLDQCKEHASEWLQTRIDAGLSSYTIKMEAAAVSKLHGISTSDLISTPARQRADIVRSRGTAQRDAHFSVVKNAEIINFCKSTGLRRSELQALRPEQLHGSAQDGYYLDVKGKGGRERHAPIIGTREAVEAVIRRIQDTPEGQPVWQRVPGHMDVHAYRAEYATEVYKKHARENIPKKDRYYCRRDLQGIVMDKAAMMAASQALGHSRIDVVAGHYIRHE